MSVRIFALVFALFTIGCTGVQNLIFAKDGADILEVRRDWGLCGGNFGGNGLPDIVAADLGAMYSCMRSKGYKTVNEARGYEKVFWVSPRSYNPLVPSHAEPRQNRDERDCGAEIEQGTGIWFVRRSKLAAMDRCMRGKGYLMSLPPQVGGIQLRN